jgi:hypothetical protein
MRFIFVSTLNMRGRASVTGIAYFSTEAVSVKVKVPG